MKELSVYIEIKGKLTLVGEIAGATYKDACFKYDADYLNQGDCEPISISLPIQEDCFSPVQTKNFFEGLLPEGFSRKAVAGWAKVSEEDYLSILEKLGRECLGAILVVEKGTGWEDGEYKKLSPKEVRDLAAEGATKSTSILLETHLSLTGASGKVGLYFDENNNEWYLPTGKLASTHIVKQSHVRLDRIVLNEQFCMNVAKKVGIDVPTSFIVDLGKGKDEEVLFATERYDRKKVKNVNNTIVCPLRLHQEDFCQAMGIAASEKYEKNNSSYMKRMFEIIREESANPIEDQMKLWDRVVVNCLLGNTDCHIKNYSLLYSDDLKSKRLAPAYDIVCTLAYGTTKEMSFYIGGELNIEKIDRQTFYDAAKEVGIGEKLALEHYDRLKNSVRQAVQEVAEVMEQEGYNGIENIKNVIVQNIDGK